MTSDSKVEPEAPLSAPARAVVDAHVQRLIVVDEQHRLIGTVSRLDVLAALVHPGSPAMGG
jgi:predicted transcriptional regulator